jgi:radical SAM protein with 4Fe4S-binding SPASM domain
LEINVTLTGGDLWLHPEYESIIRETAERDFVNRIVLMTNSLWHKEARRVIKKVKKKLARVHLNIDAYSKDSHDEDIEFLLNEGISVGVKVLLSKNNAYFESQIKILERLAKKYPNLKVAVDRLCPIEKTQLGQVVVGSEMQKMLKRVKSIGAKFITEDPLLAAERKIIECREDDLTGCPIPNGALTLYPDGKVRLCARIPDFETGFTIDNFDLLDYVKKMDWVVKARTKGCEGCPLLARCRGGCPATSFIYNGDKVGRDINCLLTNEKNFA